MLLNEKIKELRKNKNISQENLAEQLNISRQAVAKWENGETYPDTNNLIALSNIFKISIDRLLKDDNCIENTNEKDLNYQKLTEFIIKAKKNTYAGSGKEQTKSTRPNSHDLIYEENKYKYIDTYLGGERFTGEEAVFLNEEPIWAMNYSGIELSDKFSSTFLKEALSNVPKELPLRGPKIYQNGDYIYINQIVGNFEYFNGKEEIYCQKEKVYECLFHGGIIK